MNAANVHLMTNHLPVIGLFISSGLLAFALVRRDAPLIRVALYMVILTSLSSIPAYLSGEGAEEVVEHLQGVSESQIDNHESLAKIALFVSQLSGLVAFLALLAARKSEQMFKLGSVITLAASVGSFGIMGLVANSGGKISHLELRDQSVDTPMIDTQSLEKDLDDAVDDDDD